MLKQTRRLFAIGAALCAVAALGVMGAPEAQAQDEAEPTPHPQSTITIRFVRDGTPIKIGLASQFERVLADGTDCGVPTSPAGVISDGHTFKWPLGSNEPAPCTKGPPTLLRIEFLASSPIAAEFLWEGGDVTFALEVPADIRFEPESSFITIRFMTNDVLTPLLIAQNVPTILADGQVCRVGGLPTAYTADHFAITWPLEPDGRPPACSKDPPTVITIELPTEAGTIVATVLWEGSDIVYDFQLSGAPSAVSPATLPTSGGPAQAASSVGPLAAFAGLSLLLASGLLMLPRRGLRLRR